MNSDLTPLQQARVAQIKDLLQSLYAIMFDLIDQEDSLMEDILKIHKAGSHTPLEALKTLHDTRNSFKETSEEIEKLHVELETLTGSRKMGL